MKEHRRKSGGIFHTSYQTHTIENLVCLLSSNFSIISVVGRCITFYKSILKPVFLGVVKFGTCTNVSHVSGTRK